MLPLPQNMWGGVEMILLLSYSVQQWHHQQQECQMPMSLIKNCKLCCNTFHTYNPDRTYYTLSFETLCWCFRTLPHRKSLRGSFHTFRPPMENAKITPLCLKIEHRRFPIKNGIQVLLLWFLFSLEQLKTNKVSEPQVRSCLFKSPKVSEGVGVEIAVRHIRV